MADEDALSDPRRIARLAETGLLDSPPDEAFDRFTRLAATFLQAPVALVSLVDDRRQFFKSACGLPPPWAEVRGTPLSHSFCKLVVKSGEVLAVVDHGRTRASPEMPPSANSE